MTSIAVAPHWFEKQELAPGIALITEPHVHRFFRANLYHVVGQDADLVIDFGTGIHSLKAFLNIDPAKPVIALATHIHIDHVGSFHEFENRVGPKLEAKAFAAMEERVTFAKNFKEASDPVSLLPFPEWQQKDYTITAAPLSRSVHEGDVITLGDQHYSVLHLPGHSPGSIALLDEHTGVFFSGDAIYDGWLVDDMPGCDKSLYRETMQRLSMLEVSITYGGHGQPMTCGRMQDIARGYLSK